MTDYRGQRFKLTHPDTIVEVKGIEPTGRHRGKWACRNLTTGRTLHRTTRQLESAERVRVYQPNGGRFLVGDPVRYIGKPRVFHPGQGIVETGATGTIVHDFGFDYRYLILLDEPVGGRLTHANGIEFDLRPGNAWADWEKVN